MESTASPRDERVPQRLAVVLVPLGLLASSAWALLRGEDFFTALPIGAALAGLVYVVTFLDITLGLAILIGCTAFSPEFSLGNIRDLRLEDFLVPALAVSWAGRSLLARDPLAPTLVGMPVVAAALVCLVATLAGIAMGTTQPRGAGLFLAKYGEYLLVYLLFLNNVRTRQEFRALAGFAVVAAVASALATSGLSFPGGVQARLSGPSGETANIFGGYLAVHLALVLGLFLHAPGGSPRFLSAAAAVALGIPLLYTYSRTSIVALGAAAAAFALLKDRRLAVVLGIAGALLPLLAPGAIWERIATLSGVATGAEPSSWLSRVNAWQQHAPRVLSESPLLGFGIASLALGEVDNEYVRILVDTGLAGLAIFLWILARLGRAANRLHDALPPGTFERGFAAGYWMLFGTLLVHAIGATSFTAIRTMESFMVLSGLMAALHHKHPEWIPSEVPGEPRVLVDGAPILEPGRSQG